MLKDVLLMGDSCVRNHIQKPCFLCSSLKTQANFPRWFSSSLNQLDVFCLAESLHYLPCTLRGPSPDLLFACIFL